MLKLAVVGSGDVVRDRHAPILRGVLGRVAQVSYVVSSREAAVREITRELGYPVERLNSVNQLVTRDIDCALVAVPPAASADVVQLMLSLRVPLYVEQPMALTSVNALKIWEAALRQNVRVVPGENFRHQRRFARLVELFQGATPSVVEVDDRLRRGMRTNPRTDLELFREQFVHIAGAVALLAGAPLTRIFKVARHSFAGATEYRIDAEAGTATQVRISSRQWNIWSEDRYYCLLGDGQVVGAKHDYDLDFELYTDTVQWRAHLGADVCFESIVAADSGILAGWRELLDPTREAWRDSLRAGITSVQALEAVEACMQDQETVSIAPLFDDEEGPGS